MELLCLGLGLLVVRNLHEGRLGRALLAVRDHTEGAAAVGVDVRNLKLLSFTVSSVVAGLGGALLMLGSSSFDPETFSPLNSLLWFTAVVVFGADSAAGAVVAAGFIVTIDTLAPAGSSTLAVGILALTLGWLPGGLASAVRGVITFLSDRLAEDLPYAAGAPLTPAGRQSVLSVPPSGALSVAPSTSVATAVTPAGHRYPAPQNASALSPFGQALVAWVREGTRLAPVTGARMTR